MSDEMASGRGGISSNDKRTSVTAAEPAPALGFGRAKPYWFLHELGEVLRRF